MSTEKNKEKLKKNITVTDYSYICSAVVKFGHKTKYAGYLYDEAFTTIIFFFCCCCCSHLSYGI